MAHASPVRVRSETFTTVRDERQFEVNVAPIVNCCNVFIQNRSECCNHVRAYKYTFSHGSYEVYYKTTATARIRDYSRVTGFRRKNCILLKSELSVVRRLMIDDVVYPDFGRMISLTMINIHGPVQVQFVPGLRFSDCKTFTESVCRYIP